MPPHKAFHKLRFIVSETSIHSWPWFLQGSRRRTRESERDALMLDFGLGSGAHACYSLYVIFSLDILEYCSNRWKILGLGGGGSDPGTLDKKDVTYCNVYNYNKHQFQLQWDGVVLWKVLDLQKRARTKWNEPLTKALISQTNVSLRRRYGDLQWQLANEFLE